MEEMQAYFSLIQRQLKITKFEGRAAGKSQMLSLWLIVSLHGKAKSIWARAENKALGTAPQESSVVGCRGTGQLLSSCSTALGLPHRFPACTAGVLTAQWVCKQGRWSSCQILLWPWAGSVNIITVLHKPFWAGNHPHSHGSGPLKGYSNVTKVLG